MDDSMSNINLQNMFFEFLLYARQYARSWGWRGEGKRVVGPCPLGTCTFVGKRI